MADNNEDDFHEGDGLRLELAWLLREEVHGVLERVSQTLVECSRRFPFRIGSDDESLVRPQRILLSSPNNGTGQIKCVVTLLGDTICDADINFKHKLGKDHNMFKTAINPGSQWKLQQVQDAGNHLHNAISLLNGVDKAYTFSSSQQVIMLLDELMKNLNQGRNQIAFPKRKSIEELLNNRNLETLQPPVPSNVTLSFYTHASKIILALYQLQHTVTGTEIASRQQVECTVKWLNEAMILFTLALQQCQQLRDKVTVLQQCEDT
ncbi:hypothetical protein ScPMuIL_007038 [Solemya velum]